MSIIGVLLHIAVGIERHGPPVDDVLIDAEARTLAVIDHQVRRSFAGSIEDVTAAFLHQAVALAPRQYGLAENGLHVIRLHRLRLVEKRCRIIQTETDAPCHKTADCRQCPAGRHETRHSE